VNSSDPVEVLSVSQVTQAIKHRLNRDFSDVWVQGEISGISRPMSGHVYLTLKDDAAQIAVVIWRSTIQRLRFNLVDGTEIMCRGQIDVYPQRGSYQLIARSVHPIGQGALQLEFRQLYERLRGEGLFDRAAKRPIPTIPHKIAVITSPAGAAIHDFLQVVLRRWPAIDILLIPVKVQGPGAAEEIAAAIRFCGGRLSASTDVVVLTRGGGSIEDLWCFNEEIVVRAVHNCPIPTISAIGHEVDVTLTDLAADHRALTPSEAGEKVVPDRQQVLKHLVSFRQRVTSHLAGLLGRTRDRLWALIRQPSVRQPLQGLNQRSMRIDLMHRSLQDGIRASWRRAKDELHRIEIRFRAVSHQTFAQAHRELRRLATRSVIYLPCNLTSPRLDRVTELEKRLQQSMASRLERLTGELQFRETKLDAFNPKNVLKRGYSMTISSSGVPVTGCRQLHKGDKITTVVVDGKCSSIVDHIVPASDLASDKSIDLIHVPEKEPRLE
jgi:exodeoxyribonuclease VII large subunit